MKENKVIRISLTGGIIGLLTTNPRKAIEDEIKKQNAQGYKARQIVDYSTSNALIKVLQFAVLIATLTLWTWGAGYLVLLEKDV